MKTQYKHRWLEVPLINLVIEQKYSGNGQEHLYQCTKQFGAWLTDTEQRGELEEITMDSESSSVILNNGNILIFK